MPPRIGSGRIRSGASGRVGGTAAAVLELGELPFHPVQVQVDLPLVVPAEAHTEDDVVHLLGTDGRADCSPARVASTRSRKASTSSTL